MNDSETINWIEVWADPSSGGAFLLVIREFADGRYELVNPHMSNRVIERHSSYSSIRDSIEPEYCLVEGRTVIGEEVVRTDDEP